MAAIQLLAQLHQLAVVAAALTLWVTVLLAVQVVALVATADQKLEQLELLIKVIKVATRQEQKAQAVAVLLL
jgi:hypothetical protein